MPRCHLPTQPALQFRRWQADGTIDRILERLHLRLDAEGRIDPDTWFIDGTVIRASRSAADGGKKIGTLVNPRTTPWAAVAAVFPANCTWSLTDMASRWACCLRRDRSWNATPAWTFWPLSAYGELTAHGAASRACLWETKGITLALFAASSSAVESKPSSRDTATRNVPSAVARTVSHANPPLMARPPASKSWRFAWLSKSNPGAAVCIGLAEGAMLRAQVFYSNKSTIP